MKNIYTYAVFFLLILTSCNQKISQKEMSKLNGYWEIEKVVLPDGNEKKYTINETFDYFKIEKNKGFRKKVTPQFDGRFLVDNQSEQVEIIFRQDKVEMNYSTPYSKWKEELKSLSDDKMVVVNAAKITYYYKKTAPINLLEDGEKIK